MSFLDGLSMAFSGLRKQPLRACLTLLGIVIGVGAVVGVVAIADGARVMTLEEIQQTGGINMLEISRNQWERSSRGGTLVQTVQAVTGRWQKNRSEALEYPDAIALEDGTTLVAQAVAETERDGINATFEGSTTEARLIGASPGYQRSHNWYVSNGRFSTI